MNFATWSIRSPIPAIVLFLLLTLAGVVGFMRLGIRNMPDIEFPALAITATLPGAAPDQMETEVSRKIEDMLFTVNGVQAIASDISEGVSVTRVQFVLGKDLNEAFDEVRDVMTKIRPDLPPNTDEPIIKKITMSSSMEIIYSVHSSVMDEEELSWFTNNTITKTILSAKGVGGVTVMGDVSREIRLELDPVKLAALNITSSQISQQIRRIQKEVSSGLTEIGGERQTIRTLATVRSPRELAAMDIALADGRHFRLDQIATISDTTAEQTNRAVWNGVPVLGVGVSVAREASAVDMAKRVATALKELQDQTPGLQIEKVFDATAFSLEAYESSMEMLYEGAFLAVLVVWLFLRDWRATFISALALPLSIIPTFAFLYGMDFSLNTITLLAITLVVGLLVDDAIVEIENIVRHLRMGKSARQAAMDAVTEIGLAVIATTMTLVAVFLPTAFMSGITGIIFKQFGWTAVIAIIMSLLVARLITPMIAAKFLKVPSVSRTKGNSRITTWYLGLVSRALRHRHLTMVAAGVVFVASLALIPLIPMDFMPTGDMGVTMVTVSLPPGSSLETSEKIAGQVRQLVTQAPEVTGVFNMLTMETGTTFITLSHRNDRKRSQKDIEKDLREFLKMIPGVRYTVGFSGMGNIEFSFMISGQDSDLLEETSRRILDEIRTNIQGIGIAGTSSSLSQPEVIIRPDFARAAELGVTAEAIGDTLRVATVGDYSVSLPKLNVSDRQLAIRVQLSPTFRSDLKALEQLRIPGRNGLVPLAAVATLSMESGPSKISRYNRNRNNEITVELGNRTLGEVSAEVYALPSVQNLPPGVQHESVGYSEAMQDMVTGFAGAIVTGILCVYLVLVLLFKDFFHPFTILTALPLSIGGAFVLLLLTGGGLSLASLLGLILLMGIATKNSILLVDYALIAQNEHGKNQTDALLDACRKRARPIIMTSLAMSAGMLPLALGIAGDTAFSKPMAITVIGGVVTSTLLSLIIVPVAFTYVAAAKRRLNALLSKKKADISAETA